MNKERHIHQDMQLEIIKIYIFTKLKQMNITSLNDKKIEVDLKANQITTVTVGNDKKKGQVEVIKVDKDNNEIKIPDVKFEVYDEENNLVDTLVTDKDGKAVSNYYQ